MNELTDEQKILFIEAFSEQLIISSFKRIGLFKIQKMVEDKYGIQKSVTQNPEERRKLVKQIVESREKEREGYKPSLMALSTPISHESKFFVSKKISSSKDFFKVPKTLKVPEPKLPQRLSYLKPVKTNEYLDIGKLNSLIQDPNVMSLEITGPNKNVFVSGKMGNKKTGVVLTKSEIEKIVNDFSINAKIPLSDGVNKIVFGGIIMNAILSDNMDKRFSLKKIVDNNGNVSGPGNMKRKVF